MGVKRLRGNQRLRCAVNILKCSQIKVSSLCYFCSFRGPNVFKDERICNAIFLDRWYGTCNHNVT